MEERTELREELLRDLEALYQLPAFSDLAALLQGEARVLQYLALRRGEDVYPSELAEALRLWRLGFALIAAVAGLFGLTAGFIVLVGHLAGLQCLEVPYLAPFHKGRADVLRDRMVTDKFRDSLLHPEDRRKQV